MFLIPVAVTAVMAFASAAAAYFAFVSLYLPRLGIDVDELEEMGEQYEEALRSFGFIALALIAVMLAVIVLSIVLTNRFLTKFVISRVTEPLDLISDGVRRVRGGDLDTKISYSRLDEFTPVCETVNLMIEKLRRSAEETQNEEQSRRELFAGISHDLRSPLTSVRAYTEALLDGVAETPEDARRYLAKIHSRELDIERMVDRLFLFSKMEMKEYPLNLQTVGLRGELERIVSENPADGVEVALDGVNDIKVEADVSLLERAALNLIENSRKYRVKDVARVKISAKASGGTALLSFSDDGPGVSEQCLPKLFDAFYRADPSRKDPSGGSGLGLAIVKKAVERMGGEVCAKSNEQGGLTIEIKLKEAKNGDE